MCTLYTSFTHTYLEFFNPGRKKQKPSEDGDVVVPKKAKLEEGKQKFHTHTPWHWPWKGATPRGDASLLKAYWTNGLHTELKTGSLNITWPLGRVVTHLCLTIFCLCLKAYWQVSHLKGRAVASPYWLLTSMLSLAAFLLFFICILCGTFQPNTTSFPQNSPFLS